MSAGRRTVDLTSLGEAWGSTPQVGRSKRARAKADALNGPARPWPLASADRPGVDFKSGNSAPSGAGSPRSTPSLRPVPTPVGCEESSVQDFP